MIQSQKSVVDYKNSDASISVSYVNHRYSLHCTYTHALIYNVQCAQFHRMNLRQGQSPGAMWHLVTEFVSN